MRVYLDILYCPMHAWNKISVCVCLSTALRSWGSVSSSSSRLALHIHHEQIYLWYDSGMKIATHFSGLLKLSRSKKRPDCPRFSIPSQVYSKVTWVRPT